MLSAATSRSSRCRMVLAAPPTVEDDVDARKDSLQKLLNLLPERGRKDYAGVVQACGPNAAHWGEHFAEACADLLAAETARADAAEAKYAKLFSTPGMVISVPNATIVEYAPEDEIRIIQLEVGIALLRAECRASRQSDFEDGNDSVEIQMMLGTALAAARAAVDEAQALGERT